MFMFLTEIKLIIYSKFGFASYNIHSVYAGLYTILIQYSQ